MNSTAVQTDFLWMEKAFARPTALIRELKKSARILGILGMPPDPEMHPRWGLYLGMHARAVC